MTTLDIKAIEVSSIIATIAVLEETQYKKLILNKLFNYHKKLLLV